MVAAHVMLEMQNKEHPSERLKGILDKVHEALKQYRDEHRDLRKQYYEQKAKREAKKETPVEPGDTPEEKKMKTEKITSSEEFGGGANKIDLVQYLDGRKGVFKPMVGEAA